MTATATKSQERQRAKALKTANETRMHIKEVKERLRTGELTLAKALLEDVDGVGAMQVEHLLRAVPGLGHRKILRVLANAAIYSGTQRVGTLNPKRRQQLLGAIRAISPSTNIGRFNGRP